MQYYGYVLIPHETYLAWKTSVNGNGYDADGYYGDQCWDLTAEFWHNIGFPTNYPLTGVNSYAKECWTQNRYNNISYNGVQYFDLITSINEVKQGDVLVFDSGGWVGVTGHIGFADENYNGSGYIKCLGQNQISGYQPSIGGRYTSIDNLPVSTFLGAFRYRGWQQPTPTPATHKNSKFKWVLYANKIRNRQI